MPLLRVGDLSYAPFGQGANPSAAPARAIVRAIGRAKIATPATTPSDPCVLAAAARARNSPAAPGLEAQCQASKQSISVAPQKSLSIPAVLAAAKEGPCGAEPARKSANASGAAQYVDGAAGKAYLACLDRIAIKKVTDPIDARTAGGIGGCGPEPPKYAGSNVYQDKEISEHWLACMSASASSAPSSSTPAPTPTVSRPVELQQSGGGGGGASFDPGPSPSGDAPLQQSPELQKTPLSASIDIPSEMWIGLGILGAATLLGGIYLATRHIQPDRPKRRAA